MKISKRRMTKQQTPHVQNKTPHDEIDLTAARLGQRALPFFGKRVRFGANCPVLAKHFSCTP